MALFAVSLVLVLFFAGFYLVYVEELHPVYIVTHFNEKNTFQEIEPDKPLTFYFSEPVLKKDIVEGISFDPPLAGKIVFEDEFFGAYARHFSFVPDSNLEPDSFYSMHVSNLSSFYGSNFAEVDLKFQTVSSPRVESVEMLDPETASVLPHIIVNLDKESVFFQPHFSLTHGTDLEVIESEGTRLVLVPKTQLAQGVEYDLMGNFSYALDSKKIDNPFSSEYHFKTHEPIIIESTNPGDGEGAIGLSSEISITFNKHVNYESINERFAIEPSIEGDIGWEGKTMVFVPKNEYENGSEYTVKIDSGVEEYDGKGFLEQSFSFSFTPKRNEKEITPPEDVSPYYLEGKYIDVDLSGQFVTLFEDGVSQGSFLISSGRYDLPTPKGEYSVINKKPLAYSAQYDLYMPFWMAFTYQGHGFHELPFWKYRGGAEYKERESHLGTKVSHGCVRLGVGPAEQMFNFAEVGTRIYIHE